MPMYRPAPGLLSRTNTHLVLAVTLFVTSRAMMSVPPPAGKGTTRRIGLAGQACAKARGRAPAKARATRARRMKFMDCLRGSGGTVGERCAPYNAVSHSGPRGMVRNTAMDDGKEGAGGVVAVTRALNLMEAFAVGEASL